MLPQQVRDALGLTHPLPRAVVIKGHQLSEHDLLQRSHLMHLFDGTATVLQRRFLRIQVVVLVPILGDQSIPPRLADHHGIHLGVQVAPHPITQRLIWTRRLL
jgi:hypothetical protein